MVPVFVILPPLAVVKKRFVVEAVVANIFVEVLLVVVLFTPVKFWKVEEPFATIFDAERVPVKVSLPPFAVV